MHTSPKAAGLASLQLEVSCVVMGSRGGSRGQWVVCGWCGRASAAAAAEGSGRAAAGMGVPLLDLTQIWRAHTHTRRPVSHAPHSDASHRLVT